MRYQQRCQITYICSCLSFGLPCSGTAVWDPRRGDCRGHCCRVSHWTRPHRPWRRLCPACPCWSCSRTSPETNQVAWPGCVSWDVVAAPAVCALAPTVCSSCCLAPGKTRERKEGVRGGVKMGIKFIDLLAATGMWHTKLAGANWNVLMALERSVRVFQCVCVCVCVLSGVRLQAVVRVTALKLGHSILQVTILNLLCLHAAKA